MGGRPVDDGTRALYVISVAAELAGLHAQTLRIYERKGLLEPARTPGGSRRYSDRDIERLLRIQQLTDEGLNLAGVARVLELEAELGRIRRENQELRQSVQRAVDEAHRQHRRDLVPIQNAALVQWRRPDPDPTRRRPPG
jgi:MerR family transcriptional regulator/heat shock protein HspR